MKCVLMEYCKFNDTTKCHKNCFTFLLTKDRLERTFIPDEYKDITVGNNVAFNNAELKSKVLPYLKTFERFYNGSELPIKNLYLWSTNTGNGKTSTGAMILNDFFAKTFIGALKNGNKPSEHSIMFLDVNELQTLYNNFTRPFIPRDKAETSAREYYTRLEIASKSDMVLFDDIGVRDCTDAFRGDLHSCINNRLANGKVSIFTSNIPLEGIKDLYDVRLYDRIRDNAIPIHVAGESNRGIRK